MRGLLAGKPLGQAAVEAGYTRETAESKGTKLLRAEHWAVLLREAKLDDPTLAQRLHDLVHARSTKFFAHEGRVKDRRVVIDWDARAKGLDMAARIRGAYTRPGEEEAPQGQGVVAVVLKIVDSRDHRPAVPKDGAGDDLLGVRFKLASRGEAASPIHSLDDTPPHRCGEHVVQQNKRGQLVQVCGLCGKPT